MSAAQILEELPRLSPAELSAVARRLRKLKAPRAAPALENDRIKWSRELDDLAETSRRLSTGRKGAGIAEIINDIRDGR